MDIMDNMDILDIMDIMDIMDIKNIMDIMDIMDIVIMIITAWMAMADAVSALVVYASRCRKWNGVEWGKVLNKKKLQKVNLHFTFWNPASLSPQSLPLLIFFQKYFLFSFPLYIFFLFTQI